MNEELEWALLRLGGFRWIRGEYCESCRGTSRGYWFHLKGGRRFYPGELPSPLKSLDFLFQWIVPELWRRGLDYELLGWNGKEHKAIIVSRVGHWCPVLAEVIDEEPAMAFCKVVWKAVGGRNEQR